MKKIQNEELRLKPWYLLIHLHIKAVKMTISRLNCDRGKAIHPRVNSWFSCFDDKKFIFPIILLITGSCSLIIEVVAFRIISPFFGNTIFTTSSVIGITLLALSLGYYFGGITSDKNPSYQRLFRFIILSGLFTSLIIPLKLMFSIYLIKYLNLIYGPIVLSFLLFFMPNLFLGTISPYAIKLQALKKQNNIGKISGNTFFFSTIGSVIGSISTGFILIPNIGINIILLLTSLLLFLVGIIGLIILKKNNIIFKASSFLIIFSLFITYSSNNLQNHNILFSKDGVYEHLLVFDGKYQNKDTRFLIQDRSTSGAMFLDSDDTVFEYQKYFEVYKLINPNLNRVLFIGGGSNSTAKSLSNNIDDINIDIVDIEPSLSEISKIYFKSPNNFNYIVSDGRKYLKNTNDKYDLIFCDAYYSLFSIPSHFTTVEFFKEVNDKLSNNGFFFANIISSLSRKDPSIIFSILKSAKKVFPNIYLFSTTSNKSIDSQNLVIIALKNKDLDLSKIIHDKNMNSDNFIEKLKQNYVDLDRYNIDKYQLLIDDFVPIDYYSYKLISSSSSNEIEPDGNEIISIISQQLSYGPRYLGSYGHEKTKNFIFNELSVLNKENIIQKWNYKAGDNNIYELTNIISKYFPEKEKRIILATHYDSLKYAYLDKNNPKAPLPGADDSASGVAILLDIARIISLNPDKPKVGIDLIFFDGEEGDPYFGYNKDWKPIGSNYFSENIKLIYPKTKPSQAIVIDMVCKKNLKILKEGNSIKYANGVVNNFWKTANSLYPDTFLNDSGIYIDDDHMPLNKINIPSILLLDFDYKYFHTTKDTIDKCSYTSLENVEKALLKYIYSLE